MPWNFAGAGGDRAAVARGRLPRGALPGSTSGPCTPDEPAEYLKTAILGEHLERLPERAGRRSRAPSWSAWRALQRPLRAAEHRGNSSVRSIGWGAASPPFFSHLQTRRPGRQARPRRRPRVRVAVAAALPGRGAGRHRSVPAWSSPGTTARRATWPPTCGSGWRRGRCASTRAAASPTSRTWRRRRTSSGCASPRWTRCSTGRRRASPGRGRQCRRAEREGPRP